MLFVSFTAYGQLDTVNLSIYDFGIPSISGQADFVRNEAYKINLAISEVNDLVDQNLIHMFIYFGDSTTSLSYTTSWAHLTNTGDSLFIQEELEGFTMTDDTITIINGGDYDFTGSFAHDGDNGETVSVRFYNVTQTTGIPVAGANTMRAANNFMSTTVIGYSEIDAGDEIVYRVSV